MNCIYMAGKNRGCVNAACHFLSLLRIDFSRPVHYHRTSVLKQKFPAGKLSAADKRRAGTDGPRSKRGSDGAVKALLQKWNEISLVKRIICGLIIGAALGIFAPGIGVLTLLGNLFVGALRAVAPVLVFLLVMASLARAKTGSGNMGRVILLYLMATFLAALTAVIASFLFPMGITLTEAAEGYDPASGVGQVLNTLLMSVVQNPISAIGRRQLHRRSGLGGDLRHRPAQGFRGHQGNAGQPGRRPDHGGALGHRLRAHRYHGLVYNAVSTNGVTIFTEYGRLLLLLVGCMLFVAMIVNPIIVFCNIRKNPYPLVFKCLRESGITAFFTRSSAANIPVNLELCKRLQLDEDNYSVSIPLGATINMGGASVTITVMTLAVVHTLGITVDPITALILSVLAAIGACGASGVAGGSLLLIPMACSLFGIPNDIAMQAVGVGFIIGVIQDSCETALNSSTDALFTATAEYASWRKEGRKLPI